MFIFATFYNFVILRILGGFLSSGIFFLYKAILMWFYNRFSFVFGTLKSSPKIGQFSPICLSTAFAKLNFFFQRSSMEETARKKNLIFEKWQHFEKRQIGPFCKIYSVSHSRIFSIFRLRRNEKGLQNHIKAVYARNGSKKRLMIEIDLNLKSWKNDPPFCKGYSK